MDNSSKYYCEAVCESKIVDVDGQEEASDNTKCKNEAKVYVAVNLAENVY